VFGQVNKKVKRLQSTGNLTGSREISIISHYFVLSSVIDKALAVAKTFRRGPVVQSLSQLSAGQPILPASRLSGGVPPATMRYSSKDGGGARFHNLPDSHRWA
jgi:hypothetical protein